MSEYGTNASITGSLVVDGEIDLGSGDDTIYMDGEDDTLVIDGPNNRVGIGTHSPAAGSVLEVSSSDAGLLLPRVQSNSKPTATAALNGLMLYESDTHRLKIVANGEWQTISFEH